MSHFHPPMRFNQNPSTFYSNNYFSSLLVNYDTCLGSNLVSTLSSLDMNNFSHLSGLSVEGKLRMIRSQWKEKLNSTASVGYLKLRARSEPGPINNGPALIISQ